MAIYHWVRTAYQDVANAFDTDDIEDEIEEAARELGRSKDPQKDLAALTQRVADAWWTEGEEDFRDLWFEQNVDKKGRVDDEDLEGTPAEKVWEAYAAAYREAATSAIKLAILEQLNELDEDGELDDDDEDDDEEGDDDDEEEEEDES